MQVGLDVDDRQPLTLDLLPTGNWCHQGVWDDGSCFFHSLACIIDYEGYHAMSKKQKKSAGHNLRKAIRECLTAGSWAAVLAEHKMNGPPYEVVAKQLDNIKTWADYWMILFTFHMLQLNVIFYDLSKGGKPYCGVTHVRPSKNLSCGQLPSFGWKLCGIIWIKHCHFEPICLDNQFLFDPSKSPGSELIDYYDKHGECPIPTTEVLQRVGLENRKIVGGAFRSIWLRSVQGSRRDGFNVA